MTSPDVARALLHELDHADDASSPPPPSARLGITLDFDSAIAFPDLPFDPASPAARYAEAERPAVAAVLDGAGDLLRDTAPKAFAFVDAQLERAMLRRSDAAPGAASSSNRQHVGVCVLTNVQLPGDRVLVCIEALVHESVHQYLYRVELERGPFCDLGAPGRFRSPWSGNRIPLHSLVHACFVYFALLGLWYRFARRLSDPEPLALVRDRLARNLFGYRYLRPMIDGPAFPRRLVQPAILDAIRRIACGTEAADLGTDEQGRLSQSLRPCEDDRWLAGLATGLARVVSRSASTSTGGRA